MEIKKNNDYELLIEDLTMSGEGVGRIDGYALFVKDTIPGDRVIAKATKLNKNYGYGRLMSVIEPSKDRVEAKCPVAKACGGCTLMAMSYERQLEFKRHLIENNLIRIGGLSGIEVPACYRYGQPVRGMKTKPSFLWERTKTEILSWAFMQARTHSIIPNEDCLIGSDINVQEVLQKIKAFMIMNHIKSYDENSHSGLVRHILNQDRIHYRSDNGVRCH